MIDVTYSTKDWSDFWYNSNQIYPMKETLTAQQLNELVEQFVEIIVDNMDTKTLVQYVYDDLMDYYEKLDEHELKEQIDEYDEDLFDELLDNVKDVEVYEKCQTYQDLIDNN